MDLFTPVEVLKEDIATGFHPARVLVVIHFIGLQEEFCGFNFYRPAEFAQRSFGILGDGLHPNLIGCRSVHALDYDAF